MMSWRVVRSFFSRPVRLLVFVVVVVVEVRFGVVGIDDDSDDGIDDVPFILLAIRPLVFVCFNSVY